MTVSQDWPPSWPIWPSPHRCSWHAPRGLYHALWEDDLKKKDSQEHIDKIRGLIGIELPENEYELLKEQDREQVQNRYESSKAEVAELIQTFKEKGYSHGASYLETLSEPDVHEHRNMAENRSHRAQNDLLIGESVS